MEMIGERGVLIPDILRETARRPQTEIDARPDAGIFLLGFSSKPNFTRVTLL